MPIVGVKDKPFVDGAAVLFALAQHKVGTIVVEQVAARPGQGVSSMFKFGVVFGGVMSAVLASPHPVVLVTPQFWKKRAGLIGSGKDEARLKAIKLWPEQSHMLKRKKDIGRADAAMIGRFGLH